MLLLNAQAISKFSHKVPDPFLKTSSLYIGIIVHKANIKSWICFLYKKNVATASEIAYSANA